MADGDPTPRNPLAPYYPSSVPAIPGDGRRWAALLLAALLLLSAAFSLLSFVFSL